MSGNCGLNMLFGHAILPTYTKFCFPSLVAFELVTLLAIGIVANFFLSNRPSLRTGPL